MPAVVKVSLAGPSCADIIVAARPGQPRPDSAVCGGDSTSGEAAPGERGAAPQLPASTILNQTRFNLCPGSPAKKVLRCKLVTGLVK